MYCYQVGIAMLQSDYVKMAKAIQLLKNKKYSFDKNKAKVVNYETLSDDILSKISEADVDKIVCKQTYINGDCRYYHVLVWKETSWNDLKSPVVIFFMDYIRNHCGGEYEFIKIGEAGEEESEGSLHPSVGYILEITRDIHIWED